MINNLQIFCYSTKNQPKIKIKLKTKNISISAPLGTILFLIKIDIIFLGLLFVDFSLNKRIFVFEEMTKNHQFYFQSVDGGSDSPIIAKPQSYTKNNLMRNICSFKAVYCKPCLIAILAQFVSFHVCVSGQMKTYD